LNMKISVIGAGNVGAECAFSAAQRKLGEIVLLDIIEGIPQGKALDMMQAGAVLGFHANILGTNDYKDTKGSDVVVITAGLARKPGMSRDDLILKNAEIMSSIIKPIVEYSPNCIFIIVTNPLDVMTYYAYRLSGFDPRRVMGMAPLLDASRMQYFISKNLNCSVEDIYAEVLGSHGDLMVPIPRLSTVKGKPITELLTVEQVENIVKKTKDGGAEIVALLKTGSAYYAPGSAATRMAESVTKDKKEVIGTCCYLNGQYDLKDVYIGVPARLGRSGVEGIIEIELTESEKTALHAAAKSVKELCEKLPL